MRVFLFSFYMLGICVSFPVKMVDVIFVVYTKKEDEPSPFLVTSLHTTLSGKILYKN